MGFGIIWGRLVQFGTSWFSHIGAVWCNLLQLCVDSAKIFRLV